MQVKLTNLPKRIIQTMSLPKRRSTAVLRDYMAIEGQTVLDVGCGKGALVGWLKKYGAFAIGLDPQAYLLEAPAVAGVGDALPFANNSFDVVIFFNSLHHVPNHAMQSALSEAARVALELVIVVEPVAEGSHFLTVQPIDDETDVRAAAYQALKSCASLEMMSEVHWEIDYIEKDVQELIDAMIRVEPTRHDRVHAMRGELERRFLAYGRKVDNGYAFDQPMRLNALKPKI